ncbi:MAG: hypothetical protein PHN69_04550 [Candidatus Pacebacteria bacterium]|nr:hypothetical protein [Candidatus Paceibacterota bacterium]
MNYIPVTAYERKRAEWQCFLSEQQYREEHKQWSPGDFLLNNFKI